MLISRKNASAGQQNTWLCGGATPWLAETSQTPPPPYGGKLWSLKEAHYFSLCVGLSQLVRSIEGSGRWMQHVHYGGTEFKLSRYWLSFGVFLFRLYIFLITLSVLLSYLYHFVCLCLPAFGVSSFQPYEVYNSVSWAPSNLALLCGWMGLDGGVRVLHLLFLLCKSTFW